MTAPTTNLDYATSENLMVIDAYLQRAQTAKVADAEFNGWLERLDSVGDLSREQLTQVHGELIAAGYLKFEIGGSNVGLRYQVSPRGRQTLERLRQQTDPANQHGEDEPESDLSAAESDFSLDEAA